MYLFIYFKWKKLMPSCENDLEYLIFSSKRGLLNDFSLTIKTTCF